MDQFDFLKNLDNKTSLNKFQMYDVLCTKEPFRVGVPLETNFKFIEFIKTDPEKINESMLRNFVRTIDGFVQDN